MICLFVAVCGCLVIGGAGGEVVLGPCLHRLVHFQVKNLTDIGNMSATLTGLGFMDVLIRNRHDP